MTCFLLAHINGPLNTVRASFLSLAALALSVSAHAFEPTMNISVETPTTPVIHGTTNLPDGAILMLTLMRPEARYAAQSKMVVKSGKFKSERFTTQGNSLAPGLYKIEIMMVASAMNPPMVRAVTGVRGEKMTGPLVRLGTIDDKELQYTTFINLGPPAVRSEKVDSYDPIPSGWNIPMDNTPGWLAVGAQYCTDYGECEIVGRNLGDMAFKNGQTIPAEIGCKIYPAEEMCVSARIPIRLLARSPRSDIVIVRKDGRNYAAGGYGWASEQPDGSVIGGPIMVESEEELRPLHYVLNGKTRALWLQQQQQIEVKRRVQILGDLSVRNKRCDELISVVKTGAGAFTATCKVKNRQKIYKLSFRGGVE